METIIDMDAIVEALRAAGFYAGLPAGPVSAMQLNFQCAGCGAMLTPDRNIINVTPERSYHCDGCAQPGDIALPSPAVCVAVSASGNDCDLPAVYEFVATDGHTLYACETHRNPVMLTFADTEGDFSMHRFG